MRILIATYFSYPAQGGQSAYITSLKNILEKHGHSVDIFARHPVKRMFYLVGKEPIAEQLLWNKRLKQVAKRQFISNTMPTSKWIMREEIDQAVYQLCFKRLHIQSYDLIHTQDVVSTLAISRVERVNIPLISTIHGLYSHELIVDNQFVKGKCLEREYVIKRDCEGLAASNRVMIPSDYLKKRLIDEFDLVEQKASVVANGLETRPFYSEKEPQHASRRLIIACPARISKRKGQIILLDALAKLKRETTDFQCFIIGDGSLKSALKEYCDDKQLSKHVQFLGYRNDVQELLKGCDVVVLPTLNDNFPYTVMEGQAAGKVVIASKVGGIPEMIVDGKTGLLFPAGDVAALAEKLKIIIENESLRKSIEKNAFAYAKKQWAEEVFYDRIMDAYEQLDKVD